MAIDGDTIVANAKYISQKATHGEVLRFKPNKKGWGQVGTPIQGFPENGVPAQFGDSLALSQGMLTIGSPDEAPNGATYIYRETTNDGLRFEKRLSHPSYTPDSPSGAQFGHAVAVSPEYIVMGAHNESAGEGAVYIYETKKEWSLDEQLPVMGPEQFSVGSTSDMSDKYIVVSSPYNNTRRDKGSIFIYEKDNCDNWNIVYAGTSVHLPEGKEFGQAVATSNQYVVAGGKGFVSVLTDTESGWTEEVLPITNPRAGSSVDIEGSVIVVGSADNIINGGDISSTVYVYYNNNGIWELEAELKANDTDGQNPDGFGASVSISGDYIAVGSPLENNKKGAVYIFERDFDYAPGDPNRFRQADRVSYSSSLDANQFGLDLCH